jgi:hypothetical protein
MLLVAFQFFGIPQALALVSVHRPDAAAKICHSNELLEYRIHSVLQDL